MGNSSQLFVFLATAVIFVVPPVLAIDHIVGDEQGWTAGVNYSAWAQGKNIFVGDNLIFKYEKGMHNVLKVNMTEFQQCKILGEESPIETGNDVIPLKTAGKKWYFCGVAGHCFVGQKLAITVLDQVVVVPVQSPPPDATGPPTSQSPPANTSSPQPSTPPLILTPPSSPPNTTTPPQSPPPPSTTSAPPSPPGATSPPAPPPPSSGVTKLGAVSSHMGFMVMMFSILGMILA